VKCLKGGKSLFLGSLERDLPRRCVTHDNYVHKHAWPGGEGQKTVFKKTSRSGSVDCIFYSGVYGS
jgi:hypothetical protein